MARTPPCPVAVAITFPELSAIPERSAGFQVVVAIDYAFTTGPKLTLFAPTTVHAPPVAGSEPVREIQPSEVLSAVDTPHRGRAALQLHSGVRRVPASLFWKPARRNANNARRSEADRADVVEIGLSDSLGVSIVSGVLLSFTYSISIGTWHVDDRKAAWKVGLGVGVPPGSGGGPDADNGAEGQWW